MLYYFPTLVGGGVTRVCLCVSSCPFHNVVTSYVIEPDLYFNGFQSVKTRCFCRYSIPS